MFEEAYYRLYVELKFKDWEEYKRFVNNEITEDIYETSYLINSEYSNELENIETKDRSDLYFSCTGDYIISEIDWFMHTCSNYEGEFTVYAEDLESYELRTPYYILSNNNHKSENYSTRFIQNDYIATAFYQYEVGSKFSTVGYRYAMHNIDSTFFSFYGHRRVKKDGENPMLTMFENFPSKYNDYKQEIYDEYSLIFLRWEYLSPVECNYSQLRDSDKIEEMLRKCNKTILHAILLSYYGVEYEKDFVQYLIKFENCHNFINNEIKDLLLNKLNKDFSPIVNNATDEIYMLSYYITDNKLIDELYNMDEKFLKYTNNEFLNPKLLMIKNLKEL